MSFAGRMQFWIHLQKTCKSYVSCVASSNSRLGPKLMKNGKKNCSNQCWVQVFKIQKPRFLSDPVNLPWALKKGENKPKTKSEKWKLVLWPSFTGRIELVHSFLFKILNSKSLCYVFNLLFIQKQGEKI